MAVERATLTNSLHIFCCHENWFRVCQRYPLLCHSPFKIIVHVFVPQPLNPVSWWNVWTFQFGTWQVPFWKKKWLKTKNHSKERSSHSRTISETMYRFLTINIFLDIKLFFFNQRKEKDFSKAHCCFPCVWAGLFVYCFVKWKTPSFLSLDFSCTCSTSWWLSLVLYA